MIIRATSKTFSASNRKSREHRNKEQYRNRLNKPFSDENSDFRTLLVSYDKNGKMSGLSFSGGNVNEVSR